MATIFPLPQPSGIASLRFYQTGTATASFAGNQWLFVLADGTGRQSWSTGIRVTAAAGATIEFSFDGTTVHGAIASGESVNYWDRHEGGIAVRGTGTFFVEAW